MLKIDTLLEDAGLTPDKITENAEKHIGQYLIKKMVDYGLQNGLIAKMIGNKEFIKPPIVDLYHVSREYQEKAKLLERIHLIDMVIPPDAGELMGMIQLMKIDIHSTMSKTYEKINAMLDLEKEEQAEEVFVICFPLPDHSIKIYMCKKLGDTLDLVLGASYKELSFQELIKGAKKMIKEGRNKPDKKE